MPGVANILSIDLRSNPPQQQQRGGGEDSFLSILKTNSNDVQNETPRIPRREQPDRPDNSERSVAARADHRRAPDQSSPKNEIQTDAPKSGEVDATSAKDSPSKADDTSSDTNSGTNDQRASTDTSADTTVVVAAPIVPAIDPPVPIAAGLNLNLEIAIAAPAAQSDANAGEVTTPQATDHNAAASVVSSAATAIADTAVAASVADVASATAAEIVTAATTAGLATTTGPSPTEVAAPPVSKPASGSVVDPQVATNDLSIQIAAAVGSTSNTKKMAGDTSVDAFAKPDGTNKTEVTNTTPGDSTLPEIIAAADFITSFDTSKSAAPIKVQPQFPSGTPAAQTAATTLQTTSTAVSEPQPDAKEAAASVALHLAVKANAESEIDFTNTTLRLDPALIRHLPQVNPSVLMAEPVTLNPATGQFQAQVTGTVNQSIPFTSAALAVEIIARAKDGSRQFEIRLDPPELGRIDVRLHVDKSGEVSTRLTADRQETLDLLQRDSRELERALQSAGLKTNDGDLSFSLRQQTADGSANGRTQAQTNAPTNSHLKEDNEQATASIEQYQWAARLRGGIDIRI